MAKRGQIVRKRSATRKCAVARVPVVADPNKEIANFKRELAETLRQQSATAEVLSVIGNSTGDLSEVFDAMLDKAMYLCEAAFGELTTYDGKTFKTAATRGLPEAYTTYRLRDPPSYGPGTAPARLLDGEPIVHIVDLLDSDAYRAGEPNRRALVDLGGARSLLTLPLLRGQQIVGSVMIFRQESRPFSDKQIALLEHFAAQAVIGIENARLLTELHQRTDDLSESLHQQTATAEVLKVISRSTFDLQKVLNTLTELVCRLCDAYDAVLFLREGELLVFGAHCGPIPIDLATWPLSRAWTAGRSVVDRKPVHVHDLQAEEIEFPDGSAMARRMGHRTILSIPLLRADEAIGSLQIRRTEVLPFTAKQIELAETFANQAVIAIGNVRMFEQVEARTRDLSEALQQQTATADVLKVISRSTFDLQTVLDTLVESATKLCEADHAWLFQRDGDLLRFKSALAMARRRMNVSGNFSCAGKCPLTEAASRVEVRLRHASYMLRTCWPIRSTPGAKLRRSAATAQRWAPRCYVTARSSA